MLRMYVPSSFWVEKEDNVVESILLGTQENTRGGTLPCCDADVSTDVLQIRNSYVDIA